MQVDRACLGGPADSNSSRMIVTVRVTGLAVCTRCTGLDAASSNLVATAAAPSRPCGRYVFVNRVP